MSRSCQYPPSHVAASDRNKQPILEQLARLLPRSARVLEIGSGWGQHAAWFCRAIPGLDWQPSERADCLTELVRGLEKEPVAGVRPPLALDVLLDQWPARAYDAVYSANTAHIMSWRAVCAMFEGGGSCLDRGGLFCLYGPFNVGGRYTSAGNAAFDRDLKMQNPERGIRDLEALESLAGGHQMELMERISMPANNLLLVFEKAA